MSAEPLVANPLGWAQVRLLGGWRRIMMIAGVYAGAVFFLHVLLYRGMKMEGMSLAAFAGGALPVMIVITAIVILFAGANAIKRAVHRDFTSDMITSHRVTAMTGHTAVLGYLTGATVQASALTIVNWITCTLLAVIAGYPAYGPTLLIAVLGCLAVTFWTLGVLLALSTRGTHSVAWMLVVLVAMANAQIVSFLPGLALLVGFTAVSALPSTTATGVTDASVFVSMFAQLALALTFFLAAARKFARDDVQAFNPPLAYALLALCSLIAAAALRFWRGASVGAPAPTPYDLSVQTIATIGAIALVAFLPVASAAKSAAHWARRKAKDPDLQTPPPRSYLAAPVRATFVVFGIFAVVLTPMLYEIFPIAVIDEVLHRAGWVVAFFFVSLAAVAGLLRLTYARSDKAVWIMALYVVLIWAIPPFADLTLEVVYDRSPGDPQSALFACSPVGAWIIAFGKVNGPLLPGLILQTLLAAGSIILARRAKYRARASDHAIAGHPQRP